VASGEWRVVSGELGVGGGTVRRFDVMNLVLIGYRATGKTTLARLLAKRLGWEWIDADVEIERRAGKSIASIFAEDGEPAFRDLEAAVVADLCRRRRLVLAAGGGAPMRPESREAMRASGKVVWLKASPETIQARMSGDATTTARRPNLTSKGGLEEIVELLARRAAVYRQSAHLEVDTEGKVPDQIAAEIVDRAGLAAESRGGGELTG
jgi:shikimate kinase